MEIPDKSFKKEVVETPLIDSNEVLVLVMAAGVNYNGIWAGLGVPISPFDVHKAEFHIAGSDASGIVWAVGDKVRRWKVGDEVVVHCTKMMEMMSNVMAATLCFQLVREYGVMKLQMDHLHNLLEYKVNN